MVAQPLINHSSPDAVGFRGDMMKDTPDLKILPITHHRTFADTPTAAMRFDGALEQSSWGASLNKEVESYTLAVHRRYKALGIRLAITVFLFLISFASILIAWLIH